MSITNNIETSLNLMNGKCCIREVLNFGEPLPISKVPDRRDDFNNIVSKISRREQVSVSQILYKPNGTIEVNTSVSTTKQMSGMMKTDIHNLQRQWKIRSRLKNKLKQNQ
jgi:hypothetical protein